MPPMKEFDLLQSLLSPEGEFRLDRINAGATPGVNSKEEADLVTTGLTEGIAEQQSRLFVNGTRSVLVVLQGMDASGKDGAIRKVFGGVNPAGVVVTSFKRPTPIERSHDFLWRTHAATPPHGIIGIFNRSHYEDTTVVRVNADRLLQPGEKAQLPDLWQWRYKLINGFEEMLARSGTTIIKFFLHIDRDEQLRRLTDRQQKPDKHWKLEWQDIEERRHWDLYMKTYGETIRTTHTPHAPWYIIPANRKWYRNYAMATILIKTLEGLHLPPPEVSDPELLRVKIE